jgi:hypothetical protein
MVSVLIELLKDKNMTSTFNTEEKSPDIRHTIYSSKNILDIIRNEPEPTNCLLCSSREQLHPARFYYGSFKMERETKVLTRETKTESKILGYKSYFFCNECIEKMIQEKKELRKKHLKNYLIGTLLWFILFFISAASQVPAFFGIVLIVGVILLIRFTIKAGKNNKEYLALVKKMGEQKYQDILDIKAIRIFMNGDYKEIKSQVAYWTQKEYEQIKN